MHKSKSYSKTRLRGELILAEYNAQRLVRQVETILVWVRDHQQTLEKIVAESNPRKR